MRTNKEVATEVAEDICDLVSAIDDTVKGVRSEIESMEKYVRRDEGTVIFRTDQFNRPGQFNTIMNSLNVYLYHIHCVENLAF